MFRVADPFSAVHGFLGFWYVLWGLVGCLNDLLDSVACIGFGGFVCCWGWVFDPGCPVEICCFVGFIILGRGCFRVGSVKLGSVQYSTMRLNNHELLKKVICLLNIINNNTLHFNIQIFYPKNSIILFVCFFSIPGPGWDLTTLVVGYATVVLIGC